MKVMIGCADAGWFSFSGSFFVFLQEPQVHHAPLHHSLLLLGCGHWRAVTTLCAAGRAIRAARPARTRFKGGGGEAGDAAGCTGDVEAEARGVGKGGAG